MSNFHSHFKFGAFDCAYTLQVTPNGGDRSGQHFANETRGVPSLTILFAHRNFIENAIQI